MRTSLLLGAALLVASCTVQKEEEFENQAQHRYHAVAEEPVDAETRVYADKNLRVRWNEGDRISIFERRTYNQEYEFLGDNGDTAGDFDPVESSGYHTSDEIKDGHVYAVYPYDKKNKCDYEGKLTVTFPSVQHYKKDSFGVGANVMVAKTNTLDLRFMHVGGYRTFKLYGDGVSVSSVRIESNGPEYLSGRADVVMGEDGKPEVSFVESTSNSKSVELVCDTPVALGATASEAVEFWFVLPPGTLSEGFTVTITDENGNEFRKSTSNAIEIKSGVKKSMPAFEVEIRNTHISDGQQNNEIRYTTMDGNLLSIVPTAYSYIDDYDEEDNIETSLVSHEYVNGIGIMTFAHDVVLAGFEHYSPNDGRDNLLTISFPSTMTRIGRFHQCSNLSSVTVLGELQGQDYNPFTRCLNLESFEGPSAFNNWSGSFLVEDKTAISFAPKGKTSCNLQTEYINAIGMGCFEGCSSLGFVTLLDIQGIQSNAFRYCTGLLSVYLSGALEYIGNHAFEGCSNLSSVKLSSSYLSVIGESAFSGCISLKNIELPSSLTTIRAGAFQSSGLTSIVIPASVSSIGDLCFSCQSMESATICSLTPPSLDWFIDDESYVNSAPFSSSPGMQQSLSFPIYVPKNSLPSYLADSQWSKYSSRLQTMEIIQFMDSVVKSICVAHWDSNHDGELSQSEAEAVSSLGTVFSSNPTITSFPELSAFSGLTTISNNAFSGCAKLTQVALPPTIVTIGASAFEWTPNLTQITLPASLQSIQASAFAASNLSELWRLPSGVQTIGNRAFSNCKMSHMIIPDSVSSIGENAFEFCTLMTSVKLPSSLAAIKKYAFSGSGIKSITIPSTVTSIGMLAFSNCSSLSEINCLPSTPPAVDYTSPGLGMFFGMSDFTIYVSNTSIYRNAAGWSAYQDKIAYKKF